MQYKLRSILRAIFYLFNTLYKHAGETMSNNFISFNDFQNKTSKKPIETEIKPQIQLQPTLAEVKEVSQVVEQSQNSPVSNPITVDTADLASKVEKAKRQNGLIEKVADKVKGLTGLGYSSKKLDATIENVKTGTVSSEEAQKEIEKYRSSQENTAQAVGDVASGAASIGVFFGAKQGIEKLVAKYVKINHSKEIWLDRLEEEFSFILKKDKLKKIVDFAAKNIDKRSSAVAIGALGAMLVGGITKWLLLKANRIGTKQYKAEINKETMSKKEIRRAKKQAKKQRKNANFRNFTTGVINGLTVPVISALGAAGAPVYVAINSLSRYFIGSKENAGKKSISGYVENLKESPITNIATAAAIAIPAVQKGKFNKVFEENLDKAVETLQKAQLTQDLGKGKSSYQQLEEVLFGNEKIKAIMEDKSLSISQKIQLLSEENLFAVKFKQINSNTDELAQALKTDCPPTRTLEEAQALIDKAFGGKYKVQRCVGVGTVAETYLVKDGDSEYCIKMLKNGITAQKITDDKDKFFAIIDGLTDKSPQEKQFLKDNVENIYKGVLAEVDFNNEMKAAQELAKVTKKAKLVQPIEVKDGLYLMQKAKGISLSDFACYSNWKYNFIDYKTGKMFERSEFEDEVQAWQSKIDDAQKQIDDLKALLGTEEAKNYYALELDCDDGFIGEDGLKAHIKYLEDNFKTRTADCAKCLKNAQEKLKKYDKIAELHKLGIGELSEEQGKVMLERYQDILVEQFSEVSKDGKIIHGDIHPGNIFIDIEALQAGSKDFFTLIDTGNTIHQDQQMAMRFLNLSHYIKNADYENIADFVLEGATLPKGTDKATARKEIIDALYNAFFDYETHIGKITNDNILSLTDGIMQKLEIIPSDTQGNLIKAKTSAKQSMDEFTENWGKAMGEAVAKKYENKDTEITDMQIAGEMSKMFAKGMKEKKLYETKQATQEKANLALLSAADKAKLKQSKSAPKKNSVEFLTYELKQNKKTADEILSDLTGRINHYTWSFKYKYSDFMKELTGKSDFNPCADGIKKLSQKQKQELIAQLEKAQKFANMIPDETVKQQELEEIKKLLALFE